MGVNPVGNQKYFTFDGESSKTYHTHITGSGVFNAPVRSVEMISIPGRNGEYPLDAGHFDNVELTYEASIAADTVAEFAQAVADLRNWLCSKVGYCRLEDDYNPNEYRMAIYRSGLEVAPFQATSGTFDIVFDCKPQRYLKSGETAISVTSGDTITNPTRFEARPLLELTGYGKYNIGGVDMEFISEAIGTIWVHPYETAFDVNTLSLQFEDQYAAIGDFIYFEYPDNAYSVGYSLRLYGFTADDIVSVEIIGTDSTWKASTAIINYKIPELSVRANDVHLAYGTPSTLHKTITCNWTLTDSSVKTIQVDCTFSYDGQKTVTYSCEPTLSAGITYGNEYITIRNVFLVSTQSTLGNPIYIDLDIGEAYKVENDIAVSLNNAAVLPSELPTLPPGSSAITYDNTFSTFKVIPRWWRV